MEKDSEKFEKIGIENHEKSGKVAYLPILSGWLKYATASCRLWMTSIWVGRQRNRYLSCLDPCTDLHLFKRLKMLLPSRLWFQLPARDPEVCQRVLKICKADKVDSSTQITSCGVKGLMARIGTPPHSKFKPKKIEKKGKIEKKKTKKKTRNKLWKL